MQCLVGPFCSDGRSADSRQYATVSVHWQPLDWQRVHLLSRTVRRVQWICSGKRDIAAPLSQPLILLSF